MQTEVPQPVDLSCATGFGVGKTELHANKSTLFLQIQEQLWLRGLLTGRRARLGSWCQAVG